MMPVFSNELLIHDGLPLESHDTSCLLYEGIKFLPGFLSFSLFNSILYAQTRLGCGVNPGLGAKQFKCLI